MDASKATHGKEYSSCDEPEPVVAQQRREIVRSQLDAILDDVGEARSNPVEHVDQLRRARADLTVLLEILDERDA